MEEWLAISILVAATLPFVASILSSLLPSTRVRDVNDYFVYDRSLDVDGFLKATIGYSLQVAAISLFFYWSFTYGLLPPLIVCAAWSIGYWLIAQAVRKGALGAFLGSSVKEAGSETIHGYIGKRIGRSPFTGVAIFCVAVASVLGLGGTMMAEIDYATTYFVSAINISTATDLPRLTIEAAILGFTLLYVLWGGYRSVVFTDRFQVPVAYMGFCAFAVGAADLAGHIRNGTAADVLLLAIAIIIIAILSMRIRLLSKVAATPWERLTPHLTFLPILALIGIYLSLTFGGGAGNLGSLVPLLWKPGATFGFGAWGALALIFANGVWQFADISSLQRLQSLEPTTKDDQRAVVARALTSTGIESGLGWFLIVLVAGIMKLANLDQMSFLAQLAHGSNWTSYLVPLFVFTAAVYMLSTISGFISALSYISYYDLVPRVYTSLTSAAESVLERLRSARFVTILVVAVIFALYGVIRAAAKDNVAAILYGIYAFQIAILPSALAALLLHKWRVAPMASILSVCVGVVVAYLGATTATPWQFATYVGVDSVSWQVLPPLTAGAASGVVYLLIAPVENLLRPRRAQTEGNQG
jgi:hypothetical protein